MTETVKKNSKAYVNLQRFFEGIPERFKGPNSGYMDYFEEFDEIAYKDDLYKIVLMVDQFVAHFYEENIFRLCTILWHIDRMLLEHDLSHSKHASKGLKEELAIYTEFMRPTDRSCKELKLNIANLACWFFGFYGLQAAIEAFKVKTGLTGKALKGLKHMESMLRLRKTKLNWKKQCFAEMKHQCSEIEEFYYEDYIATMNKGLLELKKRGIDLRVPLFEPSKLRAKKDTIEAMAKSESVFHKLMYTKGVYILHIYQMHEAYREQVSKYCSEFEKLLLEVDRELHPKEYENMKVRN